MKQGGATGIGSTDANARESAKRSQAVGGVAGWLLERLQAGLQAGLRPRFRRTPRRAPRLTLVERISLAPRQQLALVEAEGRRLLVATSPDGAPTFYALDGGGEITPGARAASRPRRNGKPAGRVSW